MATVGICLVRDADDIIGPVVEHMLTQVDHVIVADNLSTDHTRSRLHDIPAAGRLTIAVDDDPRHLQSWKTTRLADRARRQLDAEWIVPFDADEIWYSPFGRIADVLAELPTSVFVASAALYDHVATGADDPAELDPVRRLRWRRRDPGPFPKVACRATIDVTIEDGNHAARYGPAGYPPPAVLPGRLVVRHFPYRSAEQMFRKAVIGAEALRAADLPEHIGAHWHAYAALGQDGVTEAFAEHFHAADPHRRPDLIEDPAPALPRP